MCSSFSNSLIVFDSLLYFVHVFDFSLYFFKCLKYLKSIFHHSSTLGASYSVICHLCWVSLMVACFLVGFLILSWVLLILMTFIWKVLRVEGLLFQRAVASVQHPRALSIWQLYFSAWSFLDRVGSVLFVCSPRLPIPPHYFKCGNQCTGGRLLDVSKVI